MRKPSKRMEQRRATAAAAKQKRQKVIAFGGIGVLALLLFIQGPKLLDAFGGSSEPAAAPAPVAPAAPSPEAEPRSARSALLAKATSADPFAARNLANADPQPAAVSGPAGTRDPFAKGATPTPQAPAPAPQPAPAPAPLPQRIVVGTPSSPNAVAKHGWIVVLASVRTGAGRAYAERVAKGARGRLGTVSVLDSSTRKPLRAGYFVVYTGPYASLSAVQRAAGRAHSSGYRTAYVREILRYEAAR